MKGLQQYIKSETLKERYSDYPDGEVEYTKFNIIVESERDKKRLQESFRHIHYSDIDTGIIGVNEIAHLYLEENPTIIVDSELYNKINKK